MALLGCHDPRRPTGARRLAVTALLLAVAAGLLFTLLLTVATDLLCVANLLLLAVLNPCRRTGTRRREDRAV